MTSDMPATMSLQRGQGWLPEGEEPVRGVGDLVALALVSLNLEVVRRSTLRALCPPGETRVQVRVGRKNKSANRVTLKFQHSLNKFARRGWVERDDEFVRVLDRDGLRAWVAAAVDVDEESAASLLQVEAAVAQINADLEAGVVVSGWTVAQVERDREVRRRELIELARLMSSGPTGGHPGGRGLVRVVPRGGVL